MLRNRNKKQSRRGAIVVWAAILLVVLLGFVAFGVDVGYMMLTRTQLQVGADASAMAAASTMGLSRSEMVAEAQKYAAYHQAAGEPIALADQDVEYGVWDATARTFTPSADPGNAVRVTARRTNAGLFFARVLGRDSFSTEASAVAMANPRDIAFVIDLSGSMNDDTEPAWATKTVNDKFAAQGYATVGNDLMQKVYQDFGFGAYPGKLEYIGQGLSGVQQNKYAYAQMTMNGGPLTKSNIPGKYRIMSAQANSYGHTEKERKRRAYSWIIDYQIAKVMPNAKPKPNSTSNYFYWEKYLDYIIDSEKIKAPKSSSNNSNKNKSKNKSSSNKSKNKSSSNKSKNKSSSNKSKNKSSSNKSKNKSSSNKSKSSSNKSKSSSSKSSGSSKSKSGGSGGGGSSSPAKPPTIGMIPGSSRAPLASFFLPAGRLDVWATPVALSYDNQLAMLPGGAWQGWILAETVLGTTSAQGAGNPPANRGTLPPSQSKDRIDKFNNPNKFTFPKASSSLPRALRNKIGYLTYVQFMMDYGRDIKPRSNQYTPLSKYSPDCPYHTETTAGGDFRFPPRSQPVHAARRALIAALQVVSDRNATIPQSGNRDWVSIITYDSTSGSGPTIVQPLTGDYQTAMQACTKLQAVGDKGATTATEAGLIKAAAHVAPKAEGGQGRRVTNKVVVLLTDGVPNVVSSSSADISSYINKNSSPDFYGNGADWYDAPLMQASMMEQKGWQLFPVGIGLGTDYDFLDRMARLGGTAGDSGQSPRGSGNPAEYEQRLTEIFEEIITNPKVRLVK